MKIERIRILNLRIPLVSPFETSFGKETERNTILVAVFSGGVTGWAESPTLSAPLYNEETTETAWHVMRDFLASVLIGADVDHPGEVPGLFRHIRGNNIAKSGMEGAVWDLYARTRGISLREALGGTRRRVAVGVSLGIEPAIRELLRKIERFLAEGYRKIKIKIKPGWDVEVVRSIRREFGDIPLMVDANSAYSLEDAEIFKKLDDFGLMMIEQPLEHDDIVEHAKLQRQINTPVCLDESILHAKDARNAIELGSARIINIKISRVGGMTEALAVHDLCLSRGVPVWCGGMLETGIGRAHNVAVASLEGFTIPGDTSASSRYFCRDITDPEVTVENGYIEVPSGPGTGYEANEEAIRRFTVREEVFRAD